MSRGIVLRAAFILCVLAALAGLAARKDAAGTRPGDSISQPKSAATANGTRSNGASIGRHTFSQQYDICYVDADGRPMVYERKRLVFFFPESPPEVNDRTFIETNTCQ